MGGPVSHRALPTPRGRRRGGGGGSKDHGPATTGQPHTAPGPAFPGGTEPPRAAGAGPALPLPPRRAVPAPPRPRSPQRRPAEPPPSRPSSPQGRSQPFGPHCARSGAGSARSHGGAYPPPSHPLCPPQSPRRGAGAAGARRYLPRPPAHRPPAGRTQTIWRRHKARPPAAGTRARRAGSGNPTTRWRATCRGKEGRRGDFAHA